MFFQVFSETGETDTAERVGGVGPDRLIRCWRGSYCWGQDRRRMTCRSSGYDGCCFLSWWSCRPAACVGRIVRQRKMMLLNGIPGMGVVVNDQCTGGALNAADPAYRSTPGPWLLSVARKYVCLSKQALSHRGKYRTSREHADIRSMPWEMRAFKGRG